MPGESDTYVFTRDQKASIRLNYQHWIVKEILGYNIHPSIPTNREGLQIADIATGTVIWPIEVARRLPTAHIDGFDISSQQFPARNRLPDHVNLHEHDAFQPFPDEYQGKYDIVNIRFFLTIIKTPDQVSIIIQNLMALLKPGGYLQWTEPMPDTNRASAPEGVDSTAHQNLMNMITHTVPGLNQSWIAELGTIFAKQGLGDVVSDRYPIPKELQDVSHQQMCMGYEEFMMAQISKGVSSEVAEQLKETLDSLNRAFAAGVTVGVNYYVTVGKKPV